MNGIAEGTVTNAVREDPEPPGLLFAGTRAGGVGSLDDGEHWQSLRLEHARDRRSGTW